MLCHPQASAEPHISRKKGSAEAYPDPLEDIEVVRILWGNKDNFSVLNILEIVFVFQKKFFGVYIGLIPYM